MKLRLYFFPLLLVCLAACAPDPRNQADADNSRTLTAQEASDLATARQIKQERWAQAKAVFTETMPVLVVCTDLIAVAFAISLSMSLVGTGSGIGWAGFHLGKIAVRAAEVKANQVHMDVQTRTFPLVLQYVKQGVYTCTNSGTGSVLRLDTRRPEHAEMVKAVSAVTLAGTLAYEAGHAKNQQPVHRIGELIEQFESLVNHAKVPADNL